jgi:plastocyanin
MRRTFVLLTLVVAVAIAVIAPGPSTADPADPPQPPTNAIEYLGDRFVPQPAGTKEDLKFFFGPYTVPPGHDANRIDLELPGMTGYILAIEPGMQRVADLTEPSHQEAHIHHAHWFALDPGNEEDNYTYGNTEWVFGNGDEETRADFQERSAADPTGPVYGQYVTASAPQLMIYMLHNKTAEPLLTYIVLDVTFLHGTTQELNAMTGRKHHDVSGVLFGRTYDVPRRPLNPDGTFEVAEDAKDAKGNPRPIQWTSTIEGTIIGTGGHLHPGGLSVIVENYGSKENPCPDDGRGYGGTQLLKSDAVFRNDVLFSEDFQMEVTDPAWRAPLHKGDRIRISGTYEDKDHAWYDVMTHEGLYVDEAQPPNGRCTPTLLGRPTLVGGRIRHPHVVRRRDANGRVRLRRRAYLRRATAVHRHRHYHVRRVRSANGKVRLRRYLHVVTRRRRGADGIIRVYRRPHLIRHRHPGKAVDPAAGVPNRPWSDEADLFCGEAFGGGPCEGAEPDRGAGIETSSVSIANFVYVPGDRGLSGQQGAPARVKQGNSLTFVNADQNAGIRHSVTTCPWPCNGRYVGNYPLPDGRWDSGTLGYDAVDGGSPNPVASTPTSLSVGKYAYFCRIHPWMRGAFEVVP